MITHVELGVPGQPTMARLDVLIPKNNTKFLITNIEGLEPVKADISTSGLVEIDGETFDFSRIGNRNIVLDFEYTPNYALGQTAEALRQEMYRAASPGMELEVRIAIDDSYLRKIVGYVESISSPMFSKDLVGKISIICPSPYFYGELQTKNLTANQWTSVAYEGDAPTGVLINCSLPQSIKQFTAEWQLGASVGITKLTITAPTAAIMNSGNSVQISTINFDKFAKTWSPGKNLISYMTNFNWWQLRPGGSNFVNVGMYNFDNVQVGGTYTLYYTPRFGGL